MLVSQKNNTEKLKVTHSNGQLLNHHTNSIIKLKSYLKQEGYYSPTNQMQCMISEYLVVYKSGICHIHTPKRRNSTRIRIWRWVRSWVLLQSLSATNGIHLTVRTYSGMNYALYFFWSSHLKAALFSILR